MKLTRAIVACDLNKHYLDFWPVVHGSWNNIIGIKCTLILIADEIPDNLPYKEDVVLFKPIPGVHTAFQAQCIRMLYPCLLDDSKEEGVILSDMDMIPTYKQYFVDNIQSIPSDGFFSYRGIHHNDTQIWICYVAARPSTWREIFKAKTIEDIESILKLWYYEITYVGKHGGPGWFIDQTTLYNYIVKKYEHPERIYFKNDQELDFRHLDRSEDVWRTLTFDTTMKIKYGYYKDFHMPAYEENKKQIMDIYNLLVPMSNGDPPT